jgi:GR25 family glycosyltransferase involved in LPS biosynthesis
LNFYELYKNFSAYQTFIWGHDITLFNYGTNLSVESILTKWSSKITGCICQTEWHKQLFLSSFPQVKEKMNVINNGIVVDLFNTRERKIFNRFVYTSCSERGLTKLIQLWPNILDYLPDAELLISSYNNFPKSDEDNIILEFIKKNPSVKHLGKLNRTELYKLMSTAEYWLYPSYFQETSCITSLELLASEVICLYYPVAGLVNTLGDYGIQISEGNEVDTLLNLSIKQKIELKKKGKEYALSCSWENRAKEWCNMIFSNDLQIEKNNIKIINLKRREDRKNSMISQFERENIKSNQYKFIEAVDGNELIPTAELFSLFERNDFNYKKGVIGCALSHIHLWNELMNDTENDYYVILEDDVKLCDNFKEHLDYVCKMFVEQKLEHLALGEYLSNKDFPNEDTKIETYKKDLYKEWNSFFAYILSKSAAVKSINYINNCPIKCAIDNPQAFGYILQYSSLNTKLVHCEIVNEFGSNIQTNDADNYLNFNNQIEPKEIITVSFCDWWQTEYCGGIFNVNNNFFTNLLSEHGDNYIIKSVSLNENPDILFYSIFGNSHKNYSAGRKIFFSGEPYGQREDADFNITFDANSNKNTRVPLWLCYFDNLLLDACIKRKNNQNTIPHRDNFCSFIATGPGLANNRQVFIEKLSKYKQVDCGGSFLNNIGYTVPLGINCSGKIEHNNKYKFALAFESTRYPGYVTEKICDIFKSNCIPIYWGHGDVIKDFNPNTFINANDFANFDELVDYIIKVDNNEELYKSFFKEPMLSPQWLDILTDPNKCFFKNLADNVIGKKGKKNINKLIIEDNVKLNIEENNDLWIMYAFNAHNYKVLEDYIVNLKQRYNIVYTQDTDYVLSCNPKKISYIMYINDDRIINKYKNTGVELSFLNTEPLSISYNLDLLKNYINKYPYLKIYDYSPSNLQIIFNNNMYAHLLEYSFYENENLLLNETKIYDFGIITYGNTETNTVDNFLFHKKKEVVTELIKKGFKIHIISGWGLERDIELAKCKVILNIHSVLGINDEIYYSKTFENIRCNRLLDAGFKILSEDSIHCNELINKYSINLKFIDYNDFKNIEYSENFWDKIDSNIIKKYCFIHSCNIKNVGTYRLDYLVDKLKNNNCFDIFDKIYILNIGLPIVNKYGDKFQVINYSENTQLFETPTINFMQEFSQNNSNSYILYLHTKGISYSKDDKENDWIDYMLYFLVEQSKNCISILDNLYDVVGCNYSNDLDKECFKHTHPFPPPHYSGNFWWANTNYLRTLPLLSIENPDRMTPEFWLFKNTPVFYNLHSSNVNHYHSTY